MVKRIFDIVLSLFGLIVLFPFFVVIALLIKLDSRGPVFYRHLRIGKDGEPFGMSKFRTMVELENWKGPPLSPKNDIRVTDFGRILRRFKINEFPQLMNVLRGEMSFVGPRPEVPEFVRLYSDEQKRVLSVKPGIVGPSQIEMRNEDELYVEGTDPERHYVEHILPRKLEIDLKYVQNQSFIKDVVYLFKGIVATAAGAVHRRQLFENAEQITLFGLDSLICGLSYCLSYYLRMEGDFPAVEKTIMLNTLPYVIAARMFALTYFGLYSTLVRFISVDELIKVLKATTLSSAIIVLLTFFVGHRPHPRSVFIIDWFILVCWLPGYRLSFKALREYVKHSGQKTKKNVMIYGVGNMGELALRYLKMQGKSNVVAFLDDDPKKRRKSFRGVKVLGGRHDIEPLSRLYHIDHIYIARHNLSPQELEQIRSLCEKANVHCETFAVAN